MNVCYFILLILIFYLLPMYTIITIYGCVKKSVILLFIFWIIFLLDMELNFIGKLLYSDGNLLCSSCCRAVSFCYERDFMKSLSRENQTDIIEAFNLRYLGNL